MPITHAAVNVGTAPTVVVPAGTFRSGAIANLGAATIYLGDATVTVATGFPLGAGATVTVGQMMMSGPIHAGPIHAVAAVAQSSPLNTRALTW